MPAKMSAVSVLLHTNNGVVASAEKQNAYDNATTIIANELLSLTTPTTAVVTTNNSNGFSIEVLSLAEGDAEASVTFRLFSVYVSVPLRLLLAHCRAFDSFDLPKDWLSKVNLFIDLTYNAADLDPAALVLVVDALRYADDIRQRHRNRGGNFPARVNGGGATMRSTSRPLKLEQMQAVFALCERLGLDFDATIRPFYYTLNMMERCRFEAAEGEGCIVFGDSQAWIIYRAPGIDIQRALYYQISESDAVFELADGTTKLRVLPGGDLQLETGTTPLYNILFRNTTPHLLAAQPALPFYGS